MVTYSIASLLFFVIAPGQTLEGWQAPPAPGIYPASGGKTALVGVPPEKLGGARVRYPRDVKPLLVPLKGGNRDVRLSTHFTINDFLCKGDPSLVAVSPKLVAKLESLIGTLRGDGYKVEKLRLMSAFRTPGYNRSIGNRTSHSRHIHGDAADVLADDFNRDGSIDKQDAGILMAAISRLDTTQAFRGGAALYPPSGSHGWFVHTDTRGEATRW
jgi:hypothetical protein